MFYVDVCIAGADCGGTLFAIGFGLYTYKKSHYPHVMLK